MFIDQAKILVESGKGGAGCVSFRREKYIPKGGPDGGDGGRGGNVFFVASDKIHTLYDFRYKKHYKAENGGYGTGRKMHGKDGHDLFVKVPLGTIIRAKDLETEIEEIFDLVTDGQTVLIASGGRGGKGNTRYKSSINQTPRYAQVGLAGQRKEISLELKLIAHIGLVGLPNAGKTSLLAHLTSAKPKIADYPFTTLSPNLGVLELSDHFLTIADIPGLIEGAHQGKGLGDNFLKHIERTSLLLHIVDLSSDNPLLDIEKIDFELKSYSENLLNKEKIIVFNKLDIDIAKANKALVKNIKNAFFISAASGEGFLKLKNFLDKKKILSQKDLAPINKTVVYP